MKTPIIIALYNEVGGYVVTVISIVVAFALIAAMFTFIRRSKKRKNMVKNKKKPKNTPSK